MSEETNRKAFIRDLTSRISYHPYCKVIVNGKFTIQKLESQLLLSPPYKDRINYEVVPYLRKLSSMTIEERDEYKTVIHLYSPLEPLTIVGIIDWLNEHHFDYRGMIDMGFAIEAPEDMYIFN